MRGLALEAIAKLHPGASWPHMAMEVARVTTRDAHVDLTCAALDDSPVRIERTTLRASPRGLAREYDRSWRAVDPVLAAARASHEPCHGAGLFDSARWRQEPLFEAVCRPTGLHHYLVAPLVGGGRVIGTLSFSRRKARPAFSDRDCVAVAALTGHLSALLAALTGPEGRRQTIARLTGTERVTAELAADGLTVEGIALVRNVSPNTIKETLRAVYRKLAVSSRVELLRALTAG